MNSKEGFYRRFKSKLEEKTKSWPANYVYKFILKTKHKDKIEELKNNFKDLNPKISIKISSKGTYMSISVEAKMKSPEEIINKYKNIENIEGIISL